MEITLNELHAWQRLQPALRWRDSQESVSLHISDVSNRRQEYTSIHNNKSLMRSFR
jgi:hypothetical protein